MRTSLRLITLLAAGLASAATAADELRVLTLDYAPYSYYEGGKPRGMNVEIAEEVSKRLGKPFTIQVVPWARVLAECKAGNADLIFNPIKTPDRQEFAVFTTSPISTEEVVLVAPADKAPGFTGDLATLRGLKVGVGRGFSVGKKLDEAFNSGLISKDESNNLNELGGRLLTGRIQLIANDRVTILNHMKKIGALDKVKLLSPPVEATPTYMAACKRGKAPTAAPDLEKALQQMHADGTYKKIVDRYTGG